MVIYVLKLSTNRENIWKFSKISPIWFKNRQKESVEYLSRQSINPQISSDKRFTIEQAESETRSMW